MKRSVWIGALFAPLSAPILYMVFVLIFVPDTTPKHERTVETALVALIFGFIPAIYLLSFVFGAPLIYTLKRLKKLSFFWIVSFAAPLGAIAFSCFIIVMSRGRSAGHPTPPTQSRTCGFPASGSSVVLASASAYLNAH